METFGRSDVRGRETRAQLGCGVGRPAHNLLFTVGRIGNPSYR
jgi:hypothetical protein